MFLYWFWLQFRGFTEVLLKIKKSNMADPRWPPFGNHAVISKSYDVTTSLCGPQRKQLWTYYLSFKSHCHTLYRCKVMKGVGRIPAPEGKKLGLRKQKSIQRPKLLKDRQARKNFKTLKNKLMESIQMFGKIQNK